jgi:aminopeptidase N
LGGGLRNLLWGQNCYLKFEQYCQTVLAKVGKKVGWQAKKGESHTHSLLRSLILHQLAVFNHKPTLSKGLELAKKSKKIPANIRSVVYQIAAQQGGKKQYEQFVGKYKTETLNEEQSRIGRALGQFSDVKLLKKALKFALSKEVRIQDTAQIFVAVWHNPLGKKLVWQFTKKTWPVLLKRYPASGHILNRFIKPASGFISALEAKDFAGFFKKHKSPGAERAIQQVLEKIYGSEAWLKRDAKHIENWLAGRTIND